MKDTWSGAGLGISGYPNFTLDPVTGNVLLQFTRIRVGGDRDISYRLVAEADGVVRNAILKMDMQNSDCRYSEEDLNGNLFAHFIQTRTGSITTGGKVDEWGFLGGNIDVRHPQRVFKSSQTSSGPSWFISNRWVVELITGGHMAHDWTFTESHTVYSSMNDPNGLPAFKATLIGEEVFSRVSTKNYCGVMSWSLEHGSRPLLRWYNDTTRGAGNFDTDGKDMVWTYSAGPKGCGVDASNPEVWTAPYTTDPAQLQATARRVRKDVQGMSPFPYALGFGYAMRTTNISSLFVVRLADGMAAMVPSFPQVLSWNQVLGITEEEIFVTSHMKEDSAGLTIARIRIDTLSFDLPPD